MFRTLIFFVSLFFMSLSSATPTLKGVATTSNEMETVTTLTFDSPVDATGTKVEYHNNGVQVQIPNGTATEGQKVSRVGEGGVKSVLTSPVDGGIRAKVFFENEVLPAEIEGTAKVESDSNTVTIRISKNRDVEIPPQTLEIPASEIAIVEPKAVLEAKVDQAPVGKVAGKASEDKPLNFKTREESEIPVLTATTEKKVANTATWGRMVISLAIIGLMAFGFVAFSRWYQKRGRSDVDNNKIRILTQHHLGPRKSLCIVRVAGESILIGVTDQNISMLKSLALIDDEVPDSVSKDFNATLAVADKAAAPKKTAANNGDGEDDDFVLGNIKDRISTKLKDFRPLS